MEPGPADFPIDIDKPLGDTSDGITAPPEEGQGPSNESDDRDKDLMEDEADTDGNV